MNLKKIIVALDSNNLEHSIKIVKALKKHAFAFKIGYEFFYNFGHEGYNLIKNEGVNIFLDLKLHDIPNTIEKAVKAISKLNPYFLTIHISGGDDMQKAANLSKGNIKILGVSILTSLNDDLIVCSPKEIKEIKKITNDQFLIITPGIRPDGYKDPMDDQLRTMTPKEAIDAGADYLVIGRPITKSFNPLNTLISINNSIE